MPLIWLRVAVAFYSVGLVYSILLLSKRGDLLAKVVEPAVGLGLIFHFVSLVESFALSAIFRSLPFTIPNRSWPSWRWWCSSSSSSDTAPSRPASSYFPIVFLLTLASAIGQKPVTLTSPLLRSGWVFVHVVLIFTGYAGLFLSFGASLLYIVQERALKSKSNAELLTWLPPLQTIDEICYHSLLFGFPFMTLGLVGGIGAGHR